MESVYIWIVISLKFLPKAPIDNKPPFFQMMVWRLTGDKSLSEPMLAYFADRCVTGPLWVKSDGGVYTQHHIVS